MTSGGSGSDLIPIVWHGCQCSTYKKRPKVRRGSPIWRRRHVNCIRVISNLTENWTFCAKTCSAPTPLKRSIDLDQHELHSVLPTILFWFPKNSKRTFFRGWCGTSFYAKCPIFRQIVNEPNTVYMSALFNFDFIKVGNTDNICFHISYLSQHANWRKRPPICPDDIRTRHCDWSQLATK